MSSPVIIYDYKGSPYAQKIRILLSAAGIPFQRCEQPRVMPRPDLKALGITYRRIPLLSIGKDVYCDTSCIIDALQSHFPSKALPVGPADEAYNAFADRTFVNVLYVIDLSQLPEMFIQDREGLFPAFRRKDFAEHRPSALASFKAALDTVETEFLGDRALIGGGKLSLADIHVAWVIRWGLESMGIGKGEGFGKESFPRVYKWIENIQEVEADVVTAEQAASTILAAEYISSPLSFDSKDPLRLGEGTLVSIETVDDATGLNPQVGKLIGLSRKEVVVLLENGIRVHFPRVGCCVKVAA